MRTWVYPNRHSNELSIQHVSYFEITVYQNMVNESIFVSHFYWACYFGLI